MTWKMDDSSVWVLSLTYYNPCFLDESEARRERKNTEAEEKIDCCFVPVATFPFRSCFLSFVSSPSCQMEVWKMKRKNTDTWLGKWWGRRGRRSCVCTCVTCVTCWGLCPETVKEEREEWIHEYLCMRGGGREAKTTTFLQLNMHHLLYLYFEG